MLTSLRRPTRSTSQSLSFLGVGLAGSALIAAATAWACIPFYDSGTTINPISQNEGQTLSVGAENLEPNGTNYTVRIRANGITTACHEVTQAPFMLAGSENADSGGEIADVNRTVPFVASFREGPGSICWSNHLGQENETHSSEPNSFTILPG